MHRTLAVEKVASKYGNPSAEMMGMKPFGPDSRESVYPIMSNCGLLVKLFVHGKDTEFLGQGAE